MFVRLKESEFDQRSRFEQATIYNDFARVYNLQPINIRKDADTLDGYKFLVHEFTPKERRFISLLTVGLYIKQHLLSVENKQKFFDCTFSVSPECETL